MRLPWKALFWRLEGSSGCRRLGFERLQSCGVQGLLLFLLFLPCKFLLLLLLVSRARQVCLLGGSAAGPSSLVLVLLRRTVLVSLLPCKFLLLLLLVARALLLTVGHCLIQMGSGNRKEARKPGEELGRGMLEQ